MAHGSLSRVLVTGGAGFIGRHVVRALLDEGHEVTSADKHASPDERVRSVVGNLCDPGVIADAVSPDTDVIIHLASVTSVLRSMEDPVGTFRLNAEATAGLLEQARQRGVGTFLLASSNAVTGDVGRSTITERSPLSPLTPYAATKAAAEMLLSAYVSSYGLTGAALRFSNVYGPGNQAKDSLVPRLIGLPGTARESRSTATAPRFVTWCTSTTSWPAFSPHGGPGTMDRSYSAQASR